MPDSQPKINTDLAAKQAGAAGNLGPDASDKEKAVIGSLSVVAAAAAPFAPYGTIASAVIVAGIGIYKITAGLKQEALAKEDIARKEKDYANLKNLVEDAIARITARPVVPLDLYSGPPMYWIVTEKDMPVVSQDDSSYSIQGTNLSVKWPSGSAGGSSVYRGEVKGKKAWDVTNDVDFRYIYQPMPPERSSKPAICVFFWAVPIFFARLQQKFFEQIFTISDNPEDYAGEKWDKYVKGKKVKRTKDQVCSDVMKDVFMQGSLDCAGNWYGKIGQIIPALALSDDDFAERYYGRTLWSHHQAMQNIVYSDGTRLAMSGIGKSNEIMASPINQALMKKSQEFLAKNPRIIFYEKNNVASPTTDAGQLIDLTTLLSRYHIKDPVFELARKTNNNVILKDQSLYYLTRPNLKRFWVSSSTDTPNVRTVFSTIIQSAGGALTYPQQVFQTRYKINRFSEAADPYWMPDWHWYKALSILLFPPSGTYKREVDDYTNKDVSDFVNGAFSAAPFMLYIKGRMEIEGDLHRIRPHIKDHDGFSTYGFFDFDPEDFGSNTIPGLTGVTKNWTSDYKWLRKLALMPVTNPLSIDYKTGWNNLYQNNWSFLDPEGRDNEPEIKECTFVYNTFDFGFYCKNGSPSGETPDVYEIIKTRPPFPGEETVTLTSAYWLEEAKWAWDLAKNNPALQTTGLQFAIAKPKEKLNLVQIKKAPQKWCAADEEPPLTSAYFRTNLEENKPIVQSGDPSKPSPSPFYCGRRADSRLQYAFKLVRDTQVPAAVGKTNTGWEDCHQWSWPYNNDILKAIGISSNKLFKEFSEGIGRAGLSPSSIATGPTLWGDANLYNKCYSIFDAQSRDPDDEDFKKFIGRAVWDTIMEMQTGSYSRYATHSNNMGKTMAEAMQDTFYAFASKDTAYKYYLDDIQQKCKETKTKPRRWDEKTKTFINMTPEQAASYAVSVSDAWFNGIFPKPTENYQNKFKLKDWSTTTLEDVCRAHIMLKNWALDLGKAPNKKKGVKFPSEYFTMNLLGLSAASSAAINSYNDALSAEIKNKNPVSSAFTMFQGAEKYTEDNYNQGGSSSKKIPTEYLVGGAAAALLSTAILIKLIKR